MLLDGPAPLSEQRPEARIGAVLHQTYRLDRILGIGGMGTVYAGQHVHLGHPVAVKILHPHIAAQEVALSRFRREAQIASQLGHPGLTSILDFNATEDGAPYLVMELLEGETLEERLTRGALSLPDVRTLFTQLCEALHAVHEAGVVHRDLKPENIFLLRPPPALGQPPRGWTGQQRSPWGTPLPVDQRVKVLDFGISKIQRRPAEGPAAVELTLGQEVLGTPSYLAPEQAAGDAHEADRRADVFALGTILYECLTGQRAFDGPSPMAIMRAMLTSPMPRPSERVPGLPQALDQLLARACAKDPEARFATMEALMAALLQALPTPAKEETPKAAAWDTEGDTLYDAEVGALQKAAQQAYAQPSELTPTPVIVSSFAVPGQASPIPETSRMVAAAEVRELTATDSGSPRPPSIEPRRAAITQRPLERPTALLDAVPIPPASTKTQPRWAQGHDATVDVHHQAAPPPRRPTAMRAEEGSRGWVVTASTAALAVLLGVVVGMLVLKLMSRGATPSLALERAHDLQRQLAEAEQLAQGGRCAEAQRLTRAVLQLAPQNERALSIQRSCRK